MTILWFIYSTYKMIKNDNDENYSIAIILCLLIDAIIISIFIPL